MLGDEELTIPALEKESCPKLLPSFLNKTELSWKDAWQPPYFSDPQSGWDLPLVFLSSELSPFLLSFLQLLVEAFDSLKVVLRERSTVFKWARVT